MVLEQCSAVIAGGMVDPQTLQLMMAMQAANNPRLMAPGRMLLPDHRLLTPVSQSSRASPRDDSQQRHFTQHSLMGRQPPESSLPSSQAGSQHRIGERLVHVNPPLYRFKVCEHSCRFAQHHCLKLPAISLYLFS